MVDVTSGTVVTTHDLTSGDATSPSVADFAYSIPDQVFYGVPHTGGTPTNQRFGSTPGVVTPPMSPPPPLSCSALSCWGAQPTQT